MIVMIGVLVFVSVVKLQKLNYVRMESCRDIYNTLRTTEIDVSDFYNCSNGELYHCLFDENGGQVQLCLSPLPMEEGKLQADMKTYIPQETTAIVFLSIIRSGFYIVFALNGKETVSISVQSHLNVHQLCIVLKQPRNQKLSRQDVSYLTWDQGHHREHNFCFLPRFTTVVWRDSQLHTSTSTTNEMIPISTSQTSRSWVVMFHLRRPMAFLSLNLYDMPGLVPRMNVFFFLRARRLFSKLRKQGYLLVKRLQSSFRKFHGRCGDLIQQYEVFLSRMLNEILTLDQLLLPNRSDFLPISWPWYRTWPSPNYEWFPWSISNGCDMPAGNAYPSRHLVPSPFLDLLVLLLLRSDFSNLQCPYSTFHIEYPSVLSRFCF